MALIQGARLRSIGPVAEVQGHGRTGFGGAYASNTLLAVGAAGHVGAGRGSDGVGCMWEDVAHANACAIALRGLVNEEVGESGVSAGGINSGSCKQQSLGVPELHDGSRDVFDGAFGFGDGAWRWLDQRVVKGVE